jgi:methyl-accepting chemotaxis protein
MSRTANANATAGTTDTGRHKRSVRNMLIDSRFQMKYTSFIVLVALSISGVMGGILWRTSRELVSQSEQVVAASKKVSDVVKMSIREDPIYGQNPELLAAFTSASVENDQRIEAQQAELARRQQTMLYALVFGLALMVVLIGLLGIYFTHKVAGPIYKMKMLLRQVGEGKLVFKGKLRKGDELQDFFEAFSVMVEKLRERQMREVEQLSAALELARGAGASNESLDRIGKVRDTMRSQLDL